MNRLQEARSRTDATYLSAATVQEVRAWAEKVFPLMPRNVCVFPAYIPCLLDLFPYPATVISFPHGADSTQSKVRQVEDALSLGADEIDIVAPLRYIAAHDWESFRRELEALPEVPMKLILETDLWDLETVHRASQEALAVGIPVLKTSTGALGGATQQAVQTMRLAGAEEIKASGGIRSRERAEEFLRAGATMLGSSNIEDWH
jgi:deoxyribose-phosphate aldolase